MISPWYPHGPMAAAMAMIRRPGTRWSPPWRRAASAGAAWCDSAPRGGCRRPAPPDPTPAGWGPRSIAKLVYNSNITMVYGTQITSYNYSYWGESEPTNITGGPHIVEPGWVLNYGIATGGWDFNMFFLYPNFHWLGKQHSRHSSCSITTVMVIEIS